MHFRRVITEIFCLLAMVLITPVSAKVGDVSGDDTQPRLVEAVLFYRGYNVGGANVDTTNGPKVSADYGRTWKGLAWPDAKCFSIDVSPDGRWVYVGAGNGVFVSEDGGRNWRVTGGWRVTEVLDARMDTHDPRNAWAATAYGFFKTTDGGEGWEKPGEPQPFLFSSSVCPDRTNPDRVLIGTEVGLYITNDGAKTYIKVGPDAKIRSIIQDLRGNHRFWAGTDGNGLWVSNDDGRSWKNVPGTGSIVNRVAQHPKYHERIFAGCDDGVYFSLDSCITWDKGTGKDFGTDSAFYGIAFDPEDGERIYAGCRDGFYESRDGGFNWKFVGQRNAGIWDVRYVNLYVGPPVPLSKQPEPPVIPNTTVSGNEFRDDFDAGFVERSEIGKENIADQPYKEKVGVANAVAIIKEGKADEAFYDALRATLREPGHAMFWSMPAIMLYLHCQDELPADIVELIRRSLVENSIYRGDTENHWVMYHTALLLTAQSWPDATPSEWYNGRSSKQNYDDALEWLEQWFRITTTIGQGEFDSPAYYIYFIYPMELLYDFAMDPVLKRKAGMMLDLLLSDFAADALEGRYCGGHSRLYDVHVRSGDGSQDGDMFYIYFGGVNPPKNFHGWSVSALYGSYRCPKPIFDIAHRRNKPFVHTEVKRVRNIFRYGDYPESPAFRYGGEMNPPVYRYDYMTPDYCLGSLQGGILQPIQQHTWDATWIGSAANTVCFTLHPYWSWLELAMFFPEDPHMLQSSVSYQKSGYTDEDKWTSSSPYERVFQLEDTLIAAYSVPPGDFPQHVDLFMPKCLNHEERKGWIFGHDGGFYIGIRPLVPGVWREHEDYWRYTVPAGQAAFIVETGRRADDGEYENFVKSVLLAPMADFKQTATGPEVYITTRHGRKMAYVWGDDMRLMDEPVTPFPTDKLYSGPLIESDWGSGVIRILGDEKIRVLNFNSWTIGET